MGRWQVSFRSSDFNGDDRHDRVKRGHRPAGDLAVPVPGEGQHPCPRGTFCASSTRDEENNWHPLQINSAFCPADESAITNAVPGLPESYARLSAQMTDPMRSRASGPGGRRPPGSRVLVDAGDDALLREASMVLNGWAARVRGVPGIQLSPRRHLPHTQAGVEENCGVLARFATQLLALPPGPVLRTWEYAPGRQAPPPPAPPLHSMAAGAPASARAPRQPAVPCRRCGASVTPSPSGKHWWPAVCTHAVAQPSAWAEDKNGDRYAVAWACAECSTPFRGSPPRARPACAHEPSAALQARSGGIPDGIEDQVADLEVVRAGDGWVTVITDLSGVDAGLDLLELEARFRRRLRENPSPPELLDGIPCRECEAMGLERAPLPSAPDREDGAEAPFSRCPACRDTMPRGEYDQWVARYAAWAKGAGILVCGRCEAGRHADCWWRSCQCAAAGHAAA